MKKKMLTILLTLFMLINITPASIFAYTSATVTIKSVNNIEGFKIVVSGTPSLVTGDQTINLTHVDGGQYEIKAIDNYLVIEDYEDIEEVIAYPSSGYKIIGWKETDGSTISGTLCKSGNVTLEPIVESGTIPSSYTMTVSFDNTMGSVKVSGSNISTNAQYTFNNLHHNLSYTCLYYPDPDDYGPMKINLFDYTNDYYIEAIPADGYSFVGWKLNGNTLSTLENYTNEDLREDSTLEALFSSSTPTLDFNKVSDILNTVKSNFPTYSTGIPEDAWVKNSNFNKKCYKDNNSLNVGGDFVELNSDVIKVDENTYVNNLTILCGTLTFNLENGKLISITHSGSYDSSSNGVYAPITIADVLATVPNSFPISDSDIAPDNAWINSKGKKVFLTTDTSTKLCVDEKIDVTTPINVNNNRYTINSMMIEWEFVLEEGKLVKIIARNGQHIYQDYNGEYLPQKTIADILPDGFPQSILYLPSDAWINSNDMKIYKSYFMGSSNLILNSDSNSLELSTILVKTEDGYKYTKDGKTVAFKIDNGNLIGIEVTGYTGELTKLNGKYATPVAVTFNMSEHGDDIVKNTPKNEIVVELSPAPIVEGFTFAGWYSDAKLAKAWNFASDKVTENITLYAKWIKNSDNPIETDEATITGDDEDIKQAKIELYKGTELVVSTQTDVNGKYNLGNLLPGDYNLVITKEGKITTTLLHINGNTVPQVEIPNKNVNSVLEIDDSSVENTKAKVDNVAVGGLDEIAKNKNAGTTIKLTVEQKNESTATNAESIKNKAGSNKYIEFIDLALYENDLDIGDSNTKLLTIIIPFDFTNVDVTSLMVLRHHGNSEILSKNPAADEEGYKIDKEAGSITICAKKFSNYAIAYKMNTSTNPIPAPISKLKKNIKYVAPKTGVEE